MMRALSDQRPNPFMHTLADLRAGKLAGIKRLDLSCGLSEFPAEIFELAGTLEVLNLSGNSLTSLPDDLCRLTHLRVLFASDNPFTHLPESIGQCQQLRIVGFKANRIEQVSAAALPPRLRWLILTDNRIESLPDELGRRPDLQKLMLAGNRLRSLPATLADCHRLELLRIAANRLTELPAWMLSLPALAWLAYADNPLCVEHLAEPIRPIAWQQLSIGQRLGEGASGIIQQAVWRDEDDERTVAVKLYKGSITSDGSPLNEMAACIAAGHHKHLIEVLGQISGHPAQQNGLVMELIAPDFTNLAARPAWNPVAVTCMPAKHAFRCRCCYVWPPALPRSPRTCTPTASPTAIYTATTFSGKPTVIACWVTSVRRHFTLRQAQARHWSASKRGLSVFCSENCWNAVMQSRKIRTSLTACKRCRHFVCRRTASNGRHWQRCICN